MSFQNCAHDEAPSSDAASYISLGIWLSPANNVRATKGMAPQTTMIAARVSSEIWVGKPRVVFWNWSNPSSTSSPVDDPELGVEEELPDLRGCDRRRGPCQQQPDEHEQPHLLAQLVQQQGYQRAQDHRRRHARRRWNASVRTTTSQK